MTGSPCGRCISHLYHLPLNIVKKRRLCNDYFPPSHSLDSTVTSVKVISWNDECRSYSASSPYSLNVFRLPLTVSSDLVESQKRERRNKNVEDVEIPYLIIFPLIQLSSFGSPTCCCHLLRCKKMGQSIELFKTVFRSHMCWSCMAYMIFNIRSSYSNVSIWLFSSSFIRDLSNNRIKFIVPGSLATLAHLSEL